MSEQLHIKACMVRLAGCAECLFRSIDPWMGVEGCGTSSIIARRAVTSLRRGLLAMRNTRQTLDQTDDWHEALTWEGMGALTAYQCLAIAQTHMGNANRELAEHIDSDTVAAEEMKFLPSALEWTRYILSDLEAMQEQVPPLPR